LHADSETFRLAKLGPSQLPTAAPGPYGLGPGRVNVTNGH